MKSLAMAPGVQTFVEGFHDREAVDKMKYNRLGSSGECRRNKSKW